MCGEAVTGWRYQQTVTGRREMKGDKVAEGQNAEEEEIAVPKLNDRGLCISQVARTWLMNLNAGQAATAQPALRLTVRSASQSQAPTASTYSKVLLTRTYAVGVIPATEAASQTVVQGE